METSVPVTMETPPGVTNERHGKDVGWSASKQRWQHVGRLRADDAVGGRVQHHRTTAPLRVNRQRIYANYDRFEFSVKLCQEGTADEAG